MSKIKELRDFLNSSKIRKTKSKDGKVFYSLEDLSKFLGFEDVEDSLTFMDDQNVKKTRTGSYIVDMDTIVGLINSPIPTVYCVELLRELYEVALKEIIENGRYEIKEEEEELMDFSDIDLEDIKIGEAENNFDMDDIHKEIELAFKGTNVAIVDPNDDLEEERSNMSGEDILKFLRSIKGHDINDPLNIEIANELKNFIDNEPAFMDMKLLEFQNTYCRFKANNGLYNLLMTEGAIESYKQKEAGTGKEINRYRYTGKYEFKEYFVNKECFYTVKDGNKPLKDEDGKYINDSYNVVHITPKGREWFAKTYPDLVK